MDQILEDDNIEEAKEETSLLYLSDFVAEEHVKDLIDATLSQNTPKNVLTQIIELIKLLTQHKNFIKSAELDFKHTMIEIFMNGKDDEIRVKTVEIIKMSLGDWKEYFSKFLHIFKTTESRTIRESVLSILIEYSTTVDPSVSLSVFELICMLIRSIDHDERLFATKCLVKNSNIRKDVIK